MARVSTTSDIRLTVRIAEELRAFAERQEQLALLVAGNLRLPPQLRRDGRAVAGRHTPRTPVIALAARSWTASCIARDAPTSAAPFVLIAPTIGSNEWP